MNPIEATAMAIWTERTRQPPIALNNLMNFYAFNIANRTRQQLDPLNVGAFSLVRCFFIF